MPEPTDQPAAPGPLRLAYVPGVMPAKWVRTFTERMPDRGCELVPCETADAVTGVRGGEIDAALVRLPIDRDGLHAIPLYTETTVVVFEREHLFSIAAEITTADLADETVWWPADDVLGWEDRPPGLPGAERPETTAEALEIVLAGVGVVIVPQSLARLHHDKKLRHLPLADAPVSQVALIWRIDDDSDAIEEFIGVVRGRTANSSRGRSRQTPPAADKRPERTGSADRTGDRSGRGRGTPRRSGPAPGGRRGRRRR